MVEVVVLFLIAVVAVVVGGDVPAKEKAAV